MPRDNSLTYQPEDATLQLRKQTTQILPYDKIYTTML